MTRPVHHRPGARVLVLAGDAVLLIADSDPGVAGSCWWVTPGGGVDDGESAREAAAREAHEETGLPVAPEQLEGPVAERIAVHGYSDRVLVQPESFFLLRTERFEPDRLAWSDNENRRLKGFRWWPVPELPEEVWPADLPRLARWDGGEPVQLGVMDESTVALDRAELSRVQDYLRGSAPRRSP
ncbi:NUDIX domain-containing protein [Tessaracoccus rhinocerotis]|uniref:NUDIX domain-containing protein n=1 Tax=Tessaracoccus rhinocerotis TaxID=1689449 RepID=UPI00163D91BC|nr:NUDIX domain-containing protein [Tessaracoccus rhinocerotis]